MHNTRAVAFRIFAVVVLVCAAPFPLLAQVTTATLVGQLRDTSAAVLPGAIVLVTHEGTGDMARGPSALNVHATIAKSFDTASGRRLQVRADVFNVLNRPNYNNPELRINNVDFARITGASGSRTFQFGGRLTF